MLPELLPPLVSAPPAAIPVAAALAAAPAAPASVGLTDVAGAAGVAGASDRPIPPSPHAVTASVVVMSDAAVQRSVERRIRVDVVCMMVLSWTQVRERWRVHRHAKFRAGYLIRVSCPVHNRHFFPQFGTVAHQQQRESRVSGIADHLRDTSSGTAVGTGQGDRPGHRWVRAAGQTLRRCRGCTRAYLRALRRCKMRSGDRQLEPVEAPAVFAEVDGVHDVFRNGRFGHPRRRSSGDGPPAASVLHRRACAECVVRQRCADSSRAVRLRRGSRARRVACGERPQ